MEQEISDVIIVLADRLGIAAHEVFGIFVGAQPVIGIVSIVANALGILLALYAGKRVHSYLSAACKDDDGDWEDDDYSFLEPVAVIIVVAVGLFMFVGMFSMFGDSVLRIVVPDYMAAKEIIGILKP